MESTKKQEETKPWVKTSSDEKIERLREVIKKLQRQLNMERTERNKFSSKFFSHQHHNGEIIQKMPTYDCNGGETMCAKPDPEKVYF